MAVKLAKKLRHAAPTIALSMAMVVGGISLWQAFGMVEYLRTEARDRSRIFGLVVGVLSDPSPEFRTDQLLGIVRQITDTGLPLIVTDSLGQVNLCANLEFEPDPCSLQTPRLNDPRIQNLARELGELNQPIINPLGFRIYYGESDVGRRLTGLAVTQLVMLAVAMFAGTWGYRTAAHLHRDRLWVAMARESAHQLGTPLMSAAAWIERLRDPGPDTGQIAKHLSADLDRLERVAQRFERIGRPATHQPIGVGTLVARVASYFGPRLPKHANKIRLTVEAPTSGPTVLGDPVLLEWAVEALIRNSIDALSGKGGKILVSVFKENDKVFVVVEDDGPGVGIEVRDSLFEPGISTKSGGWGLGLALASRIIDDVHAGSLRFEAIENGARFVAELPVG